MFRAYGLRCIQLFLRGVLGFGVTDILEGQRVTREGAPKWPKFWVG